MLVHLNIRAIVSGGGRLQRVREQLSTLHRALYPFTNLNLVIDRAQMLSKYVDSRYVKCIKIGILCALLLTGFCTISLFETLHMLLLHVLF